MRALLEKLGRHRMTNGERVRIDAFRGEIAAHWCPRTPAEHWLELRSRAVYAWSSLFDGAVTLQSVGVAAVVTAVGTTVQAISPPRNDAFDSHVPMWIDIGFTLAIVWFGIECLLSPRAVHRWRFAAVGFVVAVGSTLYALTYHVSAPADGALLVALVAHAAGATIMGFGAARRCDAWLQAGLAVIGVGSLGTTLSVGLWTATFALSRDRASAVGCALAACGCMMMANGLMFARPTVRTH